MDDFVAKPLRLAGLKEGLRRWRTMAAARAQANADEHEGTRSDFAIDQQAREQLRDRAGSRGGTFLGNYIDLFLDDTASRLGSLTAAFDRHDIEALRRECHALKGACLEFGVVRMARYCDELRECAEDEKLDQVRGLLGSLRPEFSRIKPVLEEEKAGQATRPSRDR
jgi:HPt (histidine-containing phosphotransfer) domain-containing protein